MLQISGSSWGISWAAFFELSVTHHKSKKNGDSRAECANICDRNYKNSTRSLSASTHTWELQQSWNLAEFLGGSCSGSGVEEVRARGIGKCKKINTSRRTDVTWNSLNSTSSLFTVSCKLNCWDSVNLQLYFWGRKYEPEQCHSLQGGCILFWDHPTAGVNAGAMASRSCPSASHFHPQQQQQLFPAVLC